MKILRLLNIIRVFLRYGLDELLFLIPPFKQVRFLLYLSPWQWMSRKYNRAQRIHLSLEALGPIFVKFGQILSTRRDLLPPDIADELIKLQDNVPPFPGDKAREIIKRNLGKSVDRLFAEFEDKPLASASIAQVHRARLFDGTEVVVKVLRPNIAKTIRSDIALMYILAGLIEKNWSEGKRLRPTEVVAEFEKTIFDELDLIREASNASMLRRNFSDSTLLYIPEVYWDYIAKDVLVMERIEGIPVSDIETIKSHGIDLKKLAEDGVEIFFTQAFTHNFFHADMHPGNIFVSQQGQYMAVDFGIMGTLTPEDKRYLAENFLAFFQRDYLRVAELHVESGWVPKNTRVDEFESAIRSVCEPIFERPLSEISFAQLLIRLFQTARRFNMEVQPQLVLLQKTLLNIEGLGRQLYPQLDLWQTAKPFLENWMKQQVGVRAFAANFKRQAPVTLERLPEIPLLLHGVLKQLNDGELETVLRPDALHSIRHEIRRANRRTVWSILGSGLLIAAALVLGLEPSSRYMFDPLWMSAGLGIAGLLGILISLRR
ncbi:MAG: ubiquinone biosynthesis regulatory protein kinase UbiB [Gammaproteobacteria bacterium]|nr:ubiquinone biosynthesis regulatory protein kinase UbiB [Gammaproteobacteria bacterium]